MSSTPAPRPSRRTVLRGGLALGAVAAAGGGALSAAPRARAADTPLPQSADVVVIGAGLSGLAAARKLAATGVNVVVVEARGRAGGRVHSITSEGGITLDGGAEFIGPTQNKIIELADAYGLRRLDTYNKGTNNWWFKGRNQRFPAWGVPMALGDVGASLAIAEIDTVCLGFPAGRPWDYRNAAALDSITWEQWLSRRVLLDSAKFFLREACSSTLSVKASEVSALYMINYFASAGDEKNKGTFERLMQVANGAQAQFVEGGAAQIPLGMARDLGGRIVYDAPVSSVTTTAAGVDVATAKGTISARRVIVAMSPAIVSRIDFRPGLPAARRNLQDGYTMGRIGKFHAVYSSPWWRDAGYSGQTIGDGTPIDVTFESYGDGHHVLMGFVSADAMTALEDATPQAYRDACISSLVKYFGPKATEYTDWAEYRWDKQEWSWGGPVAVTAPGTLTRYGRSLREPVGVIHWAGTETSDYWTGYMDGAVRSGYRAADEVAREL